MEKENHIVSEYKITYNIKRKDIFVYSLKEFYKNKLQFFFGPLTILIGIILSMTLKKVFITNLLICFGVFYSILPYIVLLFNIIKIKNHTVELVLGHNGLNFIDGNKGLKVKYENIEKVSMDDSSIRIIPKKEDYGNAKEISIPRSSINEGDIKEFIERLNSKLNTIKVKDSLGHGKFKEGTLVLKYNITKESLKHIMKVEYYDKKKHYIHGIIFAILSGLTFNINKSMCLSFMLLSSLYIFHPSIAYLFRRGSMENVDVLVYLCKDGYLEIVDNKMRIKIKPTAMKLVDNNNIFFKLLIPVKKGIVLYVPKNNIKEGNIETFLKLFS